MRVRIAAPPPARLSALRLSPMRSPTRGLIDSSSSIRTPPPWRLSAESLSKFSPPFPPCPASSLLDCRKAAVVAPDLGAVKLAERYAEILRGPVAVVRKQRESGATVSAFDTAGDVCGRPAVIIDDMITTGATIEAAAGLLRLHDAAPDIVVAATHGLLVHAAVNRLRDLDLGRVVVADTVARRRTVRLIMVQRFPHRRRCCPGPPQH